MLAFEVTSVFGGMGSWNDQTFASEPENNQFDSLTAALFAARHALFARRLHWLAADSSLSNT